MTREELLNGYKEDVRDFAKECLHFKGELDATFFDNWAEHLTNLAERLRPSLPEGLEEAAFTYENDLWESGFKDCGYSPQEVNDAFKAGAEWQKEKDTRDMFMSDNRHFNKVYELGKKDMKAKMMEGAVEGVVQDDGQFINFGDGRYIDLDPTMGLKPVFELTDGDKVKVIVIPEEK